MTEYAVTVEGTGSYQRTDVGPGAYGDWVQSQQAEFSWKSEIPTVLFIDKQASMAGGSKITASVKSASMDVSIPTPEGPVTGACTGSTWQTPPSPGLIQGQMEQPAGRESEGLWIRVLQGGDIKLNSCSGALGAGPYGMGIDGGDPSRLPPFMDFFEMPYEAIGMGKIIQLLDKTVTGVACPGYYDMTDSCTLRWNAKVTFVRTSHIEVGEPEVGPAPPEAYDPIDPDEAVPNPPAPPAQPTQPSGPGLPPRDDLDDLFIPMPGESKLAPNAASATVTMLCPQGCRGTILATLLSGGRARGAAVKKTLAKKSFVAQAGRRTVVRLRFKPAARRAIKKAGGVKIALAATPDGGGATKRTTLTLRRGR